MSDWTVHTGDCIEVMRVMDAESVNTCVTSPPYFGLRDYGHDGQIGLEPSPDEFVGKLVEVFREVRRVLRDDGTMWLNLGDSYSGGNKQLTGIPWRVAFALQADGWYLRQDIIWHKPNPMPESVRDRCTKAHEYIFLLAKSQRYYYDADAIKSPSKTAGRIDRGTAKHVGHETDAQDFRYHPKPRGKPRNPMTNKRSVWTVTPKPFNGAHFATFPPDLIEPCVLAGCPVGGVVLDPFTGAGTTGLVAVKNGRGFVGSELNPEYADMARNRIASVEPSLIGGAT